MKTQGTFFLLLLNMCSLNTAASVTKVLKTETTRLPDWYQYRYRMSTTPYTHWWIQHNKARPTINYDIYRYTTTPTPVNYSAEPNSFRRSTVIISCVYFSALTCFCVCCGYFHSCYKDKKQASKKSSSVPTVVRDAVPRQQAPRPYVSEWEILSPASSNVTRAVTSAVPTQQAPRPYLSEWETSSPYRESSDVTRAVTSAVPIQQHRPYLFELEISPPVRESSPVTAVARDDVSTQQLRQFAFEFPPYREPSPVTVVTREAVPTLQPLHPCITEWETPPPSYFDATVGKDAQRYCRYQSSNTT